MAFIMAVTDCNAHCMAHAWAHEHTHTHTGIPVGCTREYSTCRMSLCRWPAKEQYEAHNYAASSHVGGRFNLSPCRTMFERLAPKAVVMGDMADWCTLVSSPIRRTIKVAVLTGLVLNWLANVIESLPITDGPTCCSNRAAERPDHHYWRMDSSI